MSSAPAALLGNQEPRVKLEPRRSEKWTDGDDACFLASSYGMTPDPWQAAIITTWLGRHVDGRLSAGRCGVAVPRQNGKNGIVEIVELFKMIVLGRRILHTAHEVKTARKAFLRLAGFFENERTFPELAALVAPGGIRRTNGQEAILLTAGGSVEFVARSRGSGRGFTVDDLVLDEAQELSDEQLEALLPTISSAPSGDPQIIMLGTPPPPTADGAPWRRMREAGVAGKDRRLSWHEWSPATLPDPHDRAAVMALAEQTNPALHTRLQRSVVEDELAQMSWDGWLRERAGRWANSAGSAVIDQESWRRQRVNPATVSIDGETCIAVKFSADGQRVGAAVALNPTEGPVHVVALGVQAATAGASQLAKWITERWPAASLVLIDGRAGAADLVGELRAAGVPARRVRQVTTEEAVAAHAGMLRAIEDRELTHGGQPGLDAAVRVAGRRQIGNLGGWGWQSITPEGDVTALDAVTLARHGAASSKRKTNRRSGASNGRRAVVM